MFRNFLMTALRSIVKDRYYSAINILGLAVGLTVTFLIILFIHDELTYDKHHEHHERVYRLESDFTLDNKNHKFAATQIPLGPTLKDEYPEIVEYTRCAPVGTLYFVEGDREYQEDSIWFADSTFFDLFTHEFTQGDPAKALTRPNTMVITENFARRYFGKENAIGRNLTDIDNNIFEITGVIENLPGNSHLKFNGLVSSATLAERIGLERFNDRSAGSFWNIGIFSFVLLAENASLQDVLDKFPGFYEKYMKEIGDQLKGSFDLMATPLADIHLNPMSLEYDQPKGNRSYVYIFLVAALFILVIASINYMNMATARSARRSREVGMRKVSGSSRGMLIRQFLGESIFIALVSFLLSLLLVGLLLPTFNDLSGKSLDFGLLAMKELVLAGLLIALFIGFVSGLYPAFYLSGFNPLVVLKGFASGGQGGGSFRKALVLVQFAISVIMIIGTLIVSGQLRFMKTTDLGFDKEGLIVMTVRDTTLRRSFESFREEILTHPEILGAAQSSSNPGSNVNIIVQRIEGEGGELHDKAVNLYGVDYHYASLHNKIEPIVLILQDNPLAMPLFNIRTAGQHTGEVIAFIDEKRKEFGDHYPFDYAFLSENLDEYYREEGVIGTIFRYFTGLTIFIAALGLLGLSAFMAQRRTCEVGIRKVMGSSVNGIVFLFIREFSKWVIISNLIAWPLAWFAMNKWLQNFQYRTDITVWIFALAFGLSLAVAVITVSWQSIRAAVINPADSLRYE